MLTVIDNAYGMIPCCIVLFILVDLLVWTSSDDVAADDINLVCAYDSVAANTALSLENLPVHRERRVVACIATAGVHSMSRLYATVTRIVYPNFFKSYEPVSNRKDEKCIQFKCVSQSSLLSYHEDDW